MSKQVRTLLIAGIAVVALVALLVVLLLLPAGSGDDTSSAAESSDPSISLIDKSTGSDGKSVARPVKKAVIKLSGVEEVKDDKGNVTTPAKEGEEFTIVLNDEDELVVEAYSDLPINTSALNSLADDLAGIVAAEKVEGVDAALADYGFDKPLAAVTVTYHDDSEYSFEIGKRTPLKTGYYFREAGQETIYIVQDSFSETVRQGSLAYIGTRLYVSPTVEEDDDAGKAILRDMKLSGTVRPSSFAFRVITSEDADTVPYGEYVLTSPKLSMTDINALDTLTSGLTSLSAQKAFIARPTAEQLTEYGFDDPYSVADLNLAVKSVEKSEESSTDSTQEAPTRFYNVQHHVVTLGSKDDDGNYYCMIDDVPVIYLVSASSVPWAETQYNDVVSKQLFLQDITTVKSVTVIVEGKETVFNLVHHPDEKETDDKLTVTIDGETYSTSEFRTFYALLMQLSRTGDAKADPSGEPYLEIRLTLLDENSKGMTAKFYKATGSTYTCERDGEIFKANATVVENIPKQLQKYLNGETIDRNW